ncbi:MAG: hypothetical protein EOP88_24900 [Verrucomicrobiaceae bacterium]|nr:MAG: hypothetical protein EOP88_24900 [Verrucomicrobiaceae bacterium]
MEDSSAAVAHWCVNDDAADIGIPNVQTVMIPSETLSLSKAQGPFPALSLLAVLTIPLITLASIPFWLWYTNYQIENAPPGNWAPDPHQFTGVVIAIGAGICGSVAAFIGLGITWLAGLRKERRRGLRVFAWVVNGLGCVLAIAIFINHLIRLNTI